MYNLSEGEVNFSSNVVLAKGRAGKKLWLKVNDDAGSKDEDREFQFLAKVPKFLFFATGPKIGGE